MNDLEQRLQTTFSELAAHDPAGTDLAERLIANAASGHRIVVPLRRRNRVASPLLAAAVVILLAVGILVGTRFTADRPTIAPPVAPSSVPTPSAPATGSDPTSPAQPTTPTNPGATLSPDRPSWLNGALLEPAAGLPTKFSPVSTQFLDATTGFMLGTGPCGAGATQCGGLFRTRDGGATWARLATLAAAAAGNRGGLDCPVGDPGTNNCVHTVQFSDRQRGVAWGARSAFVTSDAGVTWRRIAGGRSDLRSVAQLGDTVFALESDDPGSSGDTGFPGGAHLLRSVNAVFTQVDANSLPGVPQYLTAAGDRLFVAFYSAGGTSTLSSTTDGTTWRAEPSAPCPSLELTGRSDGSLFISCFNTMKAPQGALLPAGAGSWTTFSGTPFAVDDPSEGTVLMVAASDARHFAVARYGEGAMQAAPNSWAVTRDGGAHWTATDSVNAFPVPYDTARPLTAGDGILVGVLVTERLLVTSTDLGASWTGRTIG